MNKYPDVKIGDEFGRLTVIEFSHTNEKNKKYWKCQCKCGKSSVPEASQLKSGHTKSCGCLKNEATARRNKLGRLEITGKKFNKLTATKYSHSSGGKSFWEFDCDCGNVTIARASFVKNGITESCGCLGKMDRTELIGKVFFKLTVISFDKILKKKSWWNCKCQCGKEISVARNSLVSENTKSCGCLILDTMKLRMGKNHPCWKHEISMEERQRVSEFGQRNRLPENTLWRKLIYLRDNFTCQITGVRGRNLVAHHLFNWADYPEKRFDVENGITIFVPFHKLFHKIYGNRSNTPDQFQEFKNRYDSGEWLDYQI